MGTEVYANKMEIACKASSGMSTAQFPDVCFTPPTAPPTPPGAPLPYPNTARAADCTNGSKKVSICGKEVMLKNSSYIQSTVGNEAGSAPKKGLLSSKNKGKAYFAAWSMDVTIEDKNVPRHFDIMTHNHGSQSGNGGPWCYLSVQLPPTGGASDTRCKLRPYKDGCDGDQTPHHCVPDHCFKNSNGNYFQGAMAHADGLCICVEGATKSTSKGGERVKKESYSTAKTHMADLAEHGRIHMKFDKMERDLGDSGKPKNTATIGKLESAAADAISEVTGCDRDKLKRQMRDHHRKKGLPADSKLRADPYGKRRMVAQKGMGASPSTGGASLG